MESEGTRTRGTLSALLHGEAAAGVALMAATAAALLWANSPWSESYEHVWEHALSIGIGPRSLTTSVRHLVNDGLMAVFFFVVGLEIKREILVGHLADRRRATLPLVAALGGMVVPALLYASFHVGEPTIRGWGVPMATDIAFALGVLALLGPTVPAALRAFLAALAIADDLGAVAVIALFYSEGIAWAPLLGAALAIGAAAASRGRGGAASYVAFGAVVWGLTVASGVHATVAGFLLALTVPMEAYGRPGPFLARIERALHGWMSFVVMPIFALANAGLAFAGLGGALTSSVALGVGVGLVFGKPLGIVGGAWLAVKAGHASLPHAVTWRMIVGAGLLGGIGFTMSLFIATLAFGEDPALDAARGGILLGSLCAGVAGWALLRRPARPA